MSMWSAASLQQIGCVVVDYILQPLKIPKLCHEVQNPSKHEDDL